MARSLPPLSWFRSFEAAARHLNFTAAAEELGLTQSAISQQVRALETRFGVHLFERKARGLAITDDGRKLLPQVSAALEILGAATSTFETGPTEQLLTVATSVSVAQWIIAPRLDRFLAAHPGVRLRFLSTIWPDEFKASIADVEIRFGAEKQVGRNARRLGPDPLIAVSRHIPTEDLRGETLIETVGTSMGWQHWGQAAGHSHPLAPTLYVDSFGLALELAVQGQGIALTSALLAADHLATGTLHALPAPPLANPEGYFLAIDATAPMALAFGDWLMAELAQRR
jgi:LysR family transcriptional regulator, glycine cleavage system transcriptional activator